LSNHNHIKEFRTIVIQYSGLLFTICRRYASDYETAEDYLQDSWLHIYKNFSKYNSELPLLPWMKRLTINVCLQQLRKNKIKECQLELDVIDYSPNAIDELSNEELLTLIDKMPMTNRTVFNLYVIDGYPHADIAVLLNISVNTSRSKLLRARQWLQTQLTKNIKQAI